MNEQLKEIILENSTLLDGDVASFDLHKAIDKVALFVEEEKKGAVFGFLYFITNQFPQGYKVSIELESLKRFADVYYKFLSQRSTR